MKKLIEIQAELKAPKNQRNNFGKYNYRSCEDILEAVKPLLKKHDCTLFITDEVMEVGGLVFIEARVTIQNKDGDIVCVNAQAGINPDRKGMDIAQSFGSSSSYARKYALNGLFLIDDTKDADATNDHGKAKKAKPALTDKLMDKAVKWAHENNKSVADCKQHYTMTTKIEETLKDKLVALKQLA